MHVGAIVSTGNSGGRGNLGVMERGSPMPKAPRDRTRRSKRDHDGYEGNRNEPYDDPEEHLEIERRRFRGGLPPTPELYARARQQWYRLPGSLVKPPMDPVVVDPDTGEQQTPGKGHPDGKRGE